jgi:hypothetical protein
VKCIFRTRSKNCSRECMSILRRELACGIRALVIFLNGPPVDQWSYFRRQSTQAMRGALCRDMIGATVYSDGRAASREIA